MTLRERIMADEGFVGHAYQDHLGYWTIGWGRLIDARRGGGISRAEAEMLLDNDIAAKTAELRAALPWIDQLDEPRREVLINMAFNLGVPGLLGFKLTLRYVREGDYDLAAREMLHSKWTEQVGERAARLARQMATGERQ